MQCAFNVLFDEAGDSSDKPTSAAQISQLLRFSCSV